MHKVQSCNQLSRGQMLYFSRNYLP